MYFLSSNKKPKILILIIEQGFFFNTSQIVSISTDWGRRMSYSSFPKVSNRPGQLAAFRKKHSEIMMMIASTFQNLFLLARERDSLDTGPKLKATYNGWLPISHEVCGPDFKRQCHWNLLTLMKNQ